MKNAIIVILCIVSAACQHWVNLVQSDPREDWDENRKVFLNTPKGISENIIDDFLISFSWHIG